MRVIPKLLDASVYTEELMDWTLGERERSENAEYLRLDKVELESPWVVTVAASSHNRKSFSYRSVRIITLSRQTVFHLLSSPWDLMEIVWHNCQCLFNSRSQRTVKSKDSPTLCVLLECFGTATRLNVASIRCPWWFQATVVICYRRSQENT